MFIHRAVDCHNIARRGCHCSQRTDTSEKGGWGVPLTADQMKCAFACSNPDLVQSQLSPDLQRNSPQLIPGCKGPCEVTLL